MRFDEAVTRRRESAEDARVVGRAAAAEAASAAGAGNPRLPSA
jgi:hypothetical protein